MVYDKTRGLRNNNPGNIRRSGDAWVGLSPQQTDTAFFQFSDPVYGIRALARILLNYGNNYHLDTVSKIIARWAPASDNNPTEAYTSYVSSSLGVAPDQTIDVRSELPALVRAIISYENGFNPYPATLIDQGVKMAG